MIDEKASVRRSLTHIISDEFLVFVGFYLLLCTGTEFLASVEIWGRGQIWNLGEGVVDFEDLGLEAETSL